MKVKIYIESSVRAPRSNQNGVVGYVIETDTAKGPATLTQFGTVKDVTANQSILLGLKNALSRIKSECDVIIYTDNSYVASAFAHGWIDEWMGRDWCNSRGSRIANWKEWQQVMVLLGNRLPVFEVGTEHSYKSWLDNEVKNRAKAHKY